MKLISLVLSLWLAFVAQAAMAGSVGFQQLTIKNGDDTALVAGVWYPTDASPSPQALEGFEQTVAPDGPVIRGRHLPLIVMSHGNGGWYGGHYDTALTLARAGFVVAAIDHTGDTYKDQSRAIRMDERPRDIHRLISYMLAEWAEHNRVDRAHVGAFGFSSGGFTMLVAIGGTPDLGKVAAHCAAHPDYFDCQLLKRSAKGDTAATLQALGALRGSDWVHDVRIKAAVVAAPALGYTFGREGLAAVHVPVQLWRDLDDHLLPNPDYAEAVRLALPAAPDYRLVAHADHFDFLAPCSAILQKAAPQICLSEPGFDRAAFHADFNAAVVAFFRKHLS